jgi:DnaJ-domain-containing protein 1
LQDCLAVNHYDCLKVTPDAPTEVIKAAYRALAGKLHPDRQGGTMGRDDGMHDQMAALNTAYEVLVDPTQRADYDASLIAQVTAIDDSLREHGASPAVERERETGFSETRVDVDWMTPRVMGPAALWPPTRNMLFVGGAGVLLLVLVTIFVTWQVMVRHQMERALSDQYSAHPPPAMTAAEAAEPMMPTPEVRAAPPVATRPPSSVDRQPTVAELSRMSDEQLLEVLPTLGEVPQSRAMVTPRRPLDLHHPLDGKPLNLRTDKVLIDPLAPEAPSSSP